MLHHHCRRNPELQEELQIQAAVAAGDVHTVRKMLEQGYSPNGRDANGWTLLHFSAARGKERCVRVFLEHGGEFPRSKSFLSKEEPKMKLYLVQHIGVHVYSVLNASLLFCFLSCVETCDNNAEFRLIAGCGKDQFGECAFFPPCKYVLYTARFSRGYFK